MVTKVKVLTDHRISQSKDWQASTALLKRQRWNSYLGSMLHALRIVTFWWRYDVLISANVRNAACFGLMRRVFPFGAPKIMVLEFRMDDEQNSSIWRLKRLFQRIAFRGVHLICVSAREEVITYSKRLNLRQERLKFVPWHTNVLEPHMVSTHDGYVFAAGRTGRDWSTFAKALRELPLDGVAVCTAENANAIEFSENVRVFYDIDYQRYRELLINSRIVIVTLETHVYSSGQVVFLEAMALGK